MLRCPVAPGIRRHLLDGKLCFNLKRVGETVDWNCWSYIAHTECILYIVLMCIYCVYICLVFFFTSWSLGHSTCVDQDIYIYIKQTVHNFHQSNKNHGISYATTCYIASQIASLASEAPRVREYMKMYENHTCCFQGLKNDSCPRKTVGPHTVRLVKFLGAKIHNRLWLRSTIHKHAVGRFAVQHRAEERKHVLQRRRFLSDLSVFTHLDGLGCDLPVESLISGDHCTLPIAKLWGSLNLQPSELAPVPSVKMASKCRRFPISSAASWVWNDLNDSPP